MKTLSGKLVALRAIEPSDLDILYKWENDPEVWSVSNTQIPYSKYLLQNFIDCAGKDIYSSKQLRLMIDELLTGRTVGIIDLFDFDPYHQRAGVGILIEKKSRNKGFAKESLRLIKEYAFNILLIHQLYCNIMEENESSKKLFIEEGFVLAGKKKDWLKDKAGYKDELIFQCLNESLLS